MKKFGYILIAIVLLSSAVGTYAYCRMKYKTLLIVGCARSGTTYIANLLYKGGLHIGHERMSRDGISSWDLAVNPEQGRWKVRPENHRFKHVFHQVRDPLETISSVFVTEDEDSWNYILKHMPNISPQDSHLTKCAKYWYYWNLESEKRAEWTYRLEDIEKKWGEFEQRVGKKISRSAIAQIPKTTNSRKTQNRQWFSWLDLEKELDPELYANIKTLAKKYGYSTDFIPELAPQR